MRFLQELAEQALGHTGRMCVRWSEAALNLGTTVALLNVRMTTPVARQGRHSIADK